MLRSPAGQQGGRRSAAAAPRLPRHCYKRCIMWAWRPPSPATSLRHALTAAAPAVRPAVPAQGAAWPAAAFHPLPAARSRRSLQPRENLRRRALVDAVPVVEVLRAGSESGRGREKGGWAGGACLAEGAPMRSYSPPSLCWGSQLPRAAAQPLCCAAAPPI